MNKWILGINAVVLALVVFLLIRSFDRQEEKIAYINTLKLLGDYEGMKDARIELEQKTAVWRANVDTLGMELENSIKKYEKERSSLTEKECRLSEELLRNKQGQYQQYQQAIQQKIAEEDKKISEAVLSRVNAYIEEYGKKHGYQFILGASSNGNIIFAEKAADLTEEILTGLNKEYAKN